MVWRPRSWQRLHKRGARCVLYVITSMVSMDAMWLHYG